MTSRWKTAGSYVRTQKGVAGESRTKEWEKGAGMRERAIIVIIILMRKLCRQAINNLLVGWRNNLLESLEPLYHIVADSG